MNRTGKLGVVFAALAMIAGCNLLVARYEDGFSGGATTSGHGGQGGGGTGGTGGTTGSTGSTEGGTGGAGCDPSMSADAVADTCGVFVSPTGDDNNPGTKAEPLKSITAALAKGGAIYACAGSMPYS